MTSFHLIDDLSALNGKVAIVTVANLGTGGSSGIGRAAVEYFCENGCTAVSLDISDLKDPMPKGASFIKCNVSKWEDIRNAFEEVRKLHGRVDIVCANAGNNDKEDLIRNDDIEPNWDTLDVTLKGIMMTVKAAAFHFRKNNPVGGVVIITGSITSFVPAHEGAYVYSASKYGVLGMMRSMRLAFPKFNSRIHLVCPYLTDTGLRNQAASKRELYPDQPVNEAIDIAKAMATLAADESLNGKAVICIGGRYVETEETREKLLPQVVSSEVTEKWALVMKKNPFVHMSGQ